MTVPFAPKWRLDLGVSTAALVFSVAFGAACGSSASSGVGGATQNTAGANSGDAGSSTSGDAEAGPSGIEFTTTRTVVLAPKATRELTVQTNPPGIYLVRFALPGSGGDEDPGDAVLDRNQTQTDADGIAHVVLTAPSTPANFTVRASAGVPQATLGVSVSSLGYTTLQVTPSYNGKRTVTQWTATAKVGSGLDCSQLSGTPPPDGKLIGSAADKHPVKIEQVPVGVDVLVTLRAGHYIGGCATLPPLSEGDGNTVLIYASDRPLNLADTTLDLAFGPSDPVLAFDKLLATSATLVTTALLGDAENDVAALLNEMHNVTLTTDQGAFSTAREQGAWDSALETAFGKTASRRVREPAQRWLDAGLASFDSSNTFTGTLASAGMDALFKLSSVAGLAPSDAGFASSFPATWSADSSDTLLLGTALDWVPSRLAAALATAPAVLEYPMATSVAEALALDVDCELVSSVLLANGTDTGISLYPGCDASCGVSACALGLQSLWQRASVVSATTLATLKVTATGSATVGDAAEITQLQGSWLGQLTAGDSQATASGVLSGQSASE